MANDLSSNPIVLDTTGSYLAKTPISITSVQWVSPTDAGHEALLKDENGNVIFKAKCADANYPLIKYFNPSFTFLGLNLVTLTSGELHILHGK